MNGFLPLLEAASDILRSAFLLTVLAAISAAWIAGVVIVIQTFLKRWISPDAMAVLWGIVLLRLLLPYAPASTFSIQNLLRSPEVNSSEFGATPTAIPPNSDVEVDRRPATVHSLQSMRPMNHSQSVIRAEILDFRITCVSLLWLFVGLSYILYVVASSVQMWRRWQPVSAADEPRLHELWTECCQRVGVRFPIPVMSYAGMSNPAVTGLFRPALLLPRELLGLSDDQLRMIMLHELAHIRRWDVAGHWLLVVLRAIHWWNPVYWLAAWQYQMFRERACDAFAIRHTKEASVRDYGELLLKLAERKPEPAVWRVAVPASMLGFLPSYFRKRAIQGRLRAIHSARANRRLWQSVVAMLAITSTAVCGLSDAHPQQSPQVESRSQAFRIHSVRGLPPSGNEQPVPSTYDVSKVLDKMVDDGLSSEQATPALRAIIERFARGFGDKKQQAKDGENSVVVMDGTKWTVAATKPRQALLTRYIAAWEKHGIRQISVSTQLVSCSEEFFERVGLDLEGSLRDEDGKMIDYRGAGNDTPITLVQASAKEWLPFGWTVLNERETQILRETTQRLKTQQLHWSSVTIFHGQDVAFSLGEEQDFTIAMDQDSAGRLSPKIVTLNNGFDLQFLPVLNDDGQSIVLQACVEFCNIEKVDEQMVETGGNTFSIRIPRSKRTNVCIDAEMPTGGSLLLCCPAADRRGFYFLIVAARDLQVPHGGL